MRSEDLTRRDLLGAAGAIAGALATTSSTRVFAAKTPPRAVVVGAGIAGLSAAYRLMQGGIDVEVLEANDYHGGRMVVRRLGPYFGPTHAQGYFLSSHQMFSLAEELGIEDAEVGNPINLPASNEFGSFPFGLRFSADEAARIPGMPAITRAALPRVGEAINAGFGHVDPNLPWLAGSDDAESVADFVRRIAGVEAAQPILDYAIGAITDRWGVSPEEASCVPFFSIFAQNGGEYIAPNIGITALPDELARRVKPRLGCPVMNVSAPGPNGRRTVRYINEVGKPSSITADYVVAALPATHVFSIVDGMSPEARDVFNDAEFAQTGKVTYYLKEGAGLGEPRLANPITASEVGTGDILSFFGALPAYGSEGDRHRATVVAAISEEAIPAWQSSGVSLPDFLFTPIQAALQSRFPDLARFTEDLVDDAVVIAGDYVPRMKVGMCDRARRLMDAQAKTPDGLYYAGELVSSAHVGGSCASGLYVADQIRAHRDVARA